MNAGSRVSDGVAAIALVTWRESFRRPLPYLLAVTLALLALVSRTFAIFSFGQSAQESASVGLSAVFLAGFLHACLVGSGAARRDLERGTLLLTLTSPTGNGAYLVGRLLGLFGAAATLAGLVALLARGVFALPVGPPAPQAISSLLFFGWLGTLLPILLLEGLALAVSCAVPRLFAPVVVASFFLGGSLLGHAGPVPDLSLFGLDVAGGGPPLGFSFLYALAQTGVFWFAAYLCLAARALPRSID